MREVITLIRYLRDKPELILSKGDINTFETYVSFFEGLFFCVKILKEVNIEREISSWYQDKVEIKAPNMYWFAQFDLVNEDKNEQDKIKLLLNQLEDFFTEISFDFATK